jgi:hypothetical protein
MSTYTSADQMQNLTRQDDREMETDTASLPPAQRPRNTPTFYEIMDTCTSFRAEQPKFLVTIFQTLGRQLASVKCSISHLKSTMMEMEIHKQNSTLPSASKLQQKLIDGMDSIITKNETITLFCNQAINKTNAKIVELQAIYDSGLTQLEAKLDAIKTLSPSFATMNLDNENILRCFIEESLTQFAVKSIKDKETKAKKKANFDKLKQINDEPKIITVREFDTLTKKIKQLSLKKQPNSKNLKGGPPKKKLKSPPKDQKKKGKGNGKGNSNTKSTSARQL